MGGKERKKVFDLCSFGKRPFCFVLDDEVFDMRKKKQKKKKQKQKKKKSEGPQESYRIVSYRIVSHRV